MAHAFPEEIVFAAAALRRGEIVAYPTETFYGLGVNALDELALARLRLLKGRGDKALSVLVGGDSLESMMNALCKSVPPAAKRLMDRYWPGPLTLVLPARRGLPAPLVANGFIAVRESPHPTARALVAAFGGPITATSANISGGAPATTPEAVEEVFEGRCRVLHGGPTAGGAPSTIVRVRGNRLEILRKGVLPIAETELE
ncbi:MAG TPA: L-threonylcarbamoyladenylate synthase [Polyangia bacterium]|nr:L-threonylcarbamoyladenylate synthase [Polyangia bacterium]